MTRKPPDPAPALVRFRRHQHLVRGGEPVEAIFCIRDGWAARYTMIGAGRRQITSLYLPGDYCEPQWLIDPHSTEPVIALTAVRASRLPIDSLVDFRAFGERARDLFTAIHRLLERQSAWIVSLGRKSAVERICSVLSEIIARTSAAAGASASGIVMPLTQIELADVVGLTPIHVNRVLKELKQRQVVDTSNRVITVLDPVALRAIANSGVPPA